MTVLEVSIGLSWKNTEIRTTTVLFWHPKQAGRTPQSTCFMEFSFRSLVDINMWHFVLFYSQGPLARKPDHLQHAEPAADERVAVEREQARKGASGLPGLDPRTQPSAQHGIVAAPFARRRPRSAAALEGCVNGSTGPKPRSGAARSVLTPSNTPLSDQLSTCYFSNKVTVVVLGTVVGNGWMGPLSAKYTFFV